MAERDIVFDNLKTESNLFKLKEHLREIYDLIDNRFIEIDAAASVTFDADEAEVFYVELTTNITSITIKNPFKGREIQIVFKQDGTGSRTVAGFGSDVMLAGDSFSVTSNANRHTTIAFVYANDTWIEVSRTSDV